MSEPRAPSESPAGVVPSPPNPSRGGGGPLGPISAPSSSTASSYPDHVYQDPISRRGHIIRIVNSVEPLMFPPPGSLPRPPGPATVLRAGHLRCRRGSALDLPLRAQLLEGESQSHPFLKLTVPRGLWDLSSPSWNRTLGPLVLEARSSKRWTARELPSPAPFLVAGMGPAPSGYSNCSTFFFPLLDYFKWNSAFTG